MSKKKLLSENEIRRFQGLAGIPALGEMHCPSGEREEDEVEEAMHDGARHEDDEDLDEDVLSSQTRLHLFYLAYLISRHELLTTYPSGYCCPRTSPQ